MVMLSSHILHSLGRYSCYLSHTFLSHPVLAGLQLQVMFSSHPSAFPLLMYHCSCIFTFATLTTSLSQACERSSSTIYHIFVHPETSQINWYLDCLYRKLI